MCPTELLEAGAATTAVVRAELLLRLRPLISRRVGLTIPPAACLRGTGRTLLFCGQAHSAYEHC